MSRRRHGEHGAPGREARACGLRRYLDKKEPTLKNFAKFVCELEQRSPSDYVGIDPRVRMRRGSAMPTNAPTIASTASVQDAQPKPEWFAGFPIAHPESNERSDDVDRVLLPRNGERGGPKRGNC
jgi:hypothetical protein